MNSKTFVTVSCVVILACFGLYLLVYLQDRSAELELAKAEPLIVPVAATEPANKVSLKTHVTLCQELTETIPLSGGRTVQSNDRRLINGYVRNNGNVAVSFVKVIIHWRDANDAIIDFEEVYAVSEDKLLPGAEATFASSTRNARISRCTAKVQDWWVVTDEEIDE